MRSFITLSIILYFAFGVAADPMGRLGHASSSSVKTGNEDVLAVERRRVGYAGGPKVVTPPNDLGKRVHGRRAFHSPGAAVSRGRSAAKRDLNSRLPARTVSLPLYKASNVEARTDLHPAMYFQQHLNQAHRRYARFLGHSLSDEALAERLQRRALSLNLDFDTFTLQKRGRPINLQARKQNGGNQGGTQGNGGATSNSQSNANASTSSGAGFSQLDLDALTQNTVTKAESPTAKNSLGLDIESADVGYFATVKIGTPGQNFGILMDSGSADFWVPSENCQNSNTGAKTCAHTTLGTKSSSSFAVSKQTFQVTYGTGNVQGNLIQDDVDIAGLTLKAHTFGATTTESDDFANQQVPFDGLMGLAQSSLSEQGVPTPIESLAKAGTVQAAQMGFTLGRVSDGQNIGQITFGGVDKTKFNGDLTLFSNVNKQGFWEGNMDDITVNGKSLKLAGRTAILDTGTTLIVAPQADAEAVHAAIPGAQSDGQGGFTVPCTTNAAVALSFGNKAFTIQSSDLAVQPLTNNLQGDCASGISAGQIGGANEWLVGDVFLKNVYFATDIDNNQIGLAPAAGVKGNNGSSNNNSNGSSNNNSNGGSKNNSNAGAEAASTASNTPAASTASDTAAGAGGESSTTSSDDATSVASQDD